MQNSVIKEFQGNPNVVAAIYDEGGARGETRSWLETVWTNFHLRGKIIWDEAGANSRNNYNQPNTGLPFGRWYVIDQAGKIVLASFGYDPDLAIRTIRELLDRPSLGACRYVADGTEVRLSGKVVSAGTAQIGGAFYIEESDRSGGIRVKWAKSAVPMGTTATVVGHLSTSETGEREIVGYSVTLGGSASVQPIGIGNRGLGGRSPGSCTSGVTGSTDPYNIGLLVISWGRVTEVGSGCFWIDDGSSITSDTGHAGVRVEAPWTLAAGFGRDAYVVVTGISSCIKSGGGTLRRLLPRSADDISVVKPSSGS